MARSAYPFFTPLVMIRIIMSMRRSGGRPFRAWRRFWFRWWVCWRSRMTRVRQMWRPRRCGGNEDRNMRKGYEMRLGRGWDCEAWWLVTRREVDRDWSTLLYTTVFVFYAFLVITAWHSVVWHCRWSIRRLRWVLFFDSLCFLSCRHALFDSAAFDQQRSLNSLKLAILTILLSIDTRRLPVTKGLHTTFDKFHALYQGIRE